MALIGKILRPLASPLVLDNVLTIDQDRDVSDAINDARYSTNAHPEQQVGAAYLVEQTPTIAGVVEDETPTRKDRTRLSCRASDFDGINQRFYSTGRVTSSAKTQLSVSAWVRPTAIDASRGILSEYDAGANEQSWLMYYNSSGQLIVSISENGSAAGKTFFTASNTLVVDEWYHVCFTFDGTQTGGDLTLFLNGKEITPTVTSPNSSVESLFDTTTDLQIGSITNGANLYDGQIQQPLIYEGVWSADQVRDIYLQKTDASITYGWHLDADTAHTLTSASPALTPANSPSLYEDDAVPVDWLNEKGWNNSGTLAPKRWDEELDSLGNAATDSTSFGVAKRNAQLRGSSNAVQLNGINQYGTITNTDDFSASDWTLSGYFSTETLVGNKALFSQLNGSGTGETWLRTANTTGVFQTEIGGTTSAFNSVTAASIGVDYYFTLAHDSTANELTLSVTNLDSSTTTSETVSRTMVAATGNFNFGSSKTPADFFKGPIWGFKLDNANGFNIPMSETTGSTSDDVSGNGKDCTWQNSPERVDQDLYFWNENKGYDSVGTFDGVDDFVAIGTVSSPIESTVSIWFNKSTSGSDRVLHFGRTLFQINGSGQLIYFRDTGQSSTTFNSLGWTTNEWVHLMLTHVGDDVKVYIDNVLQGSVAGYGAINTSSNASYIGSYQGASFFFNGLLRDVRTYSRELTSDERTFIYTNGASGIDPSLVDCQFKYDISDGSGLTATDSSGNGNDGTINGATSDEFWGGPKIPAKADGTSLIRSAPSNPAGPWLYEGDATYVDFDVVANANQWLEQRWQDTEGDGVGYLTLDSAITLSGAFDVEFLHYASSYASAESIIGHSSETSQIGFSSTKYFIRVLNGGSSDNTIAAPSINQWHSVKIARDSSDIVTATIDGTETTLFSGAAQSGNFVINQIFKGTLGIFTGNVRNVKITDDTTIVMDFDSLIDLDLSSSLNNTTETVTDITYNRLTDTSYTAGDVVEQPFSVNDDTSGRVSELIQFTFPVTTLSSTPTISQTVFEDGNTVTQDGILISES